MKKLLKDFYKDKIAPLICRIRGHVWVKRYLTRWAGNTRVYRTHCSRCDATGFQIDPVVRKVVKTTRPNPEPKKLKLFPKKY